MAEGVKRYAACPECGIDVDVREDRATEADLLAMTEWLEERTPDIVVHGPRRVDAHAREALAAIFKGEAEADVEKATRQASKAWQAVTGNIPRPDAMEKAVAAALAAVFQESA